MIVVGQNRGRKTEKGGGGGGEQLEMSEMDPAQDSRTS